MNRTVTYLRPSVFIGLNTFTECAYLALIKNHEDISNGSRVIALTNVHTSANRHLHCGE